MDNDKDKHLIKSPYYELEKLTKDSAFVKRGLRDLSIWPKIEDLYKQVQEKYNADSINECIGLCLEILDIEPHHLGTLFFYGMCLYKKAEYEKAIIYFTQVIDGAGDLRILVSRYRGACYFETGNYQRAFEDYKAFLPLPEKKNKAWVLRMMATCLVSLGNVEDANFCIDEAITIENEKDSGIQSVLQDS